MNHPYKIYENTKHWETIEKAIMDLETNQDINLLTAYEYVIGYIYNKLDSANLLMYIN